MTFHYPELYNTFSELQREETKRFLNENIKRLSWRANERILDIGSGDGKTTSEVLKNFLPENYRQLLGIDRSEEMVTFANKHYGNNGVEFERQEFTKELPANYLGSFDHVFSFFAIQWINDQRKVYSQIYDVLRDSGDCLLLIVGHFPALYDVYQCLAKSIRWNPWVQDLKRIRSMYHEYEDAEVRATEMMKHAGFKHVDVRRVSKRFKYESEEYYENFTKALNPLVFPEDVKEDFFKEFVKVSQKEGFINEDMSLEYTLFYVYARK